MRFSIELKLENELISKDKNKIILSMLKRCFSSYNIEYYNELYETTGNKVKEFTFSLYMGNCTFQRDEILIPNKEIKLNFSAYNNEDGIMFYNSFLSSKGKKQTIHNNTITIGSISLLREKTVYDNEVIYNIMSPIVVREHVGDNKKTWYHSLKTEEGQAIFRNNLKHQLVDALGERVLFDFDDLCFEIAPNNREVKVKYYGIEILSNIGKIKMKAKPYILDYLFKAGIGGKRGSGFGMVDIV